jgi:probable phosphoglycerate mutase
MPNPSKAASAAQRIAYIDGGSRGNPGPAGYGVVIQDSTGRLLETLSQPIGEATNNIAEYRALLAVLEYAAHQRVGHLKVYCDSELVVRQMQGRYRVQSPDLKPLFQRARELANSLTHFTITHIPREQNRMADKLANQAMDQGGSAARPAIRSFFAVAEKGALRPLHPLPDLEDGAEYEVRARKRGAARESK